MSSPLKLLYVCTHNACRSILAEVVTREVLGDRVEVCSAGSNPAGRIHPLTIQYLEQQGHTATGLASESFEEHRRFDPDIVVTVCDSAANEVCPLWLEPTASVHWGLPDPSHATGDEQAKLAAFTPVVQIIAKRLSALSELDFEDRDTADIARAMQSMGSLK
ncbi:MAG: arsenate reductase ArsC [Halieaceae bacterium]